VGKSCLKIVRVENASLTELAGTLLEIITVRLGTCILITSLSYLSRVGATAYTAEWRVAVDMLVSRWAEVPVCPVFPLHFSEILGPLFGELLILYAWYKKMYTGTNQGLKSSWSRYSEILLEFAEGAGSLDQPELITPLLPSSLDPRSNFVPTHFSTSSTSLSIIYGLDKKFVYELLLSLTVSLCRGFSISAHPESILARDSAEPSEGAKENKAMTIILAGASYLASLMPVFKSNGAVVNDLTKPGWMITESNIESLKSELSALSTTEDVAIIFDLFGNTAYRFRHVDGSLVLPFCVGGDYHLLGDIHMVSDSGIGELISMVKPHSPCVLCF
jgi:glycerol uptake facilitator-like aquaporin